MSKRAMSVLVLVLLLLGAARFLSAIAKERQRWVSKTYMESVHELSSTAGAPQRRWGPLFPAVMSAAQSVSRVIPTPLLLRILLGICYAWTLYMLVMWSKGGGEFSCREALIVSLGLQSTAAIYGLANGSGEFITGGCIVGNAYFFMRRRYAIAALLLCVGVYFKLHPVVYAFPYFLFAALSAAHRRYCAYVAAFGVAIGLLCVPLAGWANGFFYPFSMLQSVSKDASIIPIISKEVFAPIFFIGRALTSFAVRPADAELTALTMRMTTIFSILLILTTAVAAIVLRRTERKWDATPQTRRYALLVFDATIGFLFFFCAVDFSLLHFILIPLSLFAPALLLLRDDCGLADGARSRVAAALYAIGMVVIGFIVPLSILLRLLPLAALDRMTGNAGIDLIAQEKYIWYQIPMFGLLCVVAAFVLSARRRAISEAASVR
jgi:hypothetical protein